ncbi:MAG: SMP-30/gluconolactonase/LRE family protein [Acetobacteraceae bacterium]
MERPFEILDQRFAKLCWPTPMLEKIHTGCRFTEGAVYFGDHRCLLFSDVPSSRMYRWDEETGAVTVYRANSNHANGNTRDREGRLVTCEHGARRVTRTELDGTITVLAERWQGKRLNSPNDVVVKSDGTVWFTDPRYGLDSYFEGGRGESEIGSCNVYRLDPRDGSLEVVVDDFARPNGLAFSPDESKLYIVDSGLFPDPNGPHHIRAFDVTDNGRLRGGEVLIEVSPGIPDGLRLDTEGNIWCSAQDGVHCITPGGELIGKIHTPEICANVVFGGPKRNRLFLCAYTSIYAVYVEAIGVQRP